MLIKGHDHDRSTIAFYFTGPGYKLLFTFFQADRIYNALTLYAFQARLYYVPFRRINHYRNTADIRFGTQEAEKVMHQLFGIQHAFVHTDIDDLGTVKYLLTCDIQCIDEIIFSNKTQKFW